MNEIDIEQDIQSFLNSEIDQEATAEKFQIDNVDKLDWAIRKWKKTDADAQQKIECARRQIEKLTQYIDNIKSESDSKKSFLESMMQPFIIKSISGSKAKSFKSPSGKVGIRQQSPYIEKNEEELVNFLRQLNRSDLIDTIEAPKWAELKKEIDLVITDTSAQYVTKDGEIVPVKVTLRPEKIYVEVD